MKIFMQKDTSMIDLFLKLKVKWNFARCVNFIVVDRYNTMKCALLFQKQKSAAKFDKVQITALKEQDLSYRQISKHIKRF